MERVIPCAFHSGATLSNCEESVPSCSHLLEKKEFGGYSTRYLATGSSSVPMPGTRCLTVTRTSRTKLRRTWNFKLKSCTGRLTLLQCTFSFGTSLTIVAGNAFRSFCVLRRIVTAVVFFCCCRTHLMCVSYQGVRFAHSHPTHHLYCLAYTRCYLPQWHANPPVCGWS